MFVQLRILLVYDGIAAIVQQVGGVDVTGQGKGLSGQLQRISHHEGVGVAGHGYQVIGLEESRLLQYPASYVRQGDPVPGRIEMFRSAGYLCRLEGDAPDTSLLQGKFDDLTYLVIVDALLEGNYQGGGKIQLIQVFQGFQPDVRKVLATQTFQRLRLEGVELQVDFEVGTIGSQPRGKFPVLRNTDTIGIYHQVTDGLFTRYVQNGKEVRMQGGFPAADLHYIRPPFIGNDDIQHFFHFLHG